MNRIKALRKARNIKQIELCKYLGIVQGTLSGWENEKYEPDLNSLKKMSEFFGVSIDYLLGVDESDSNIRKNNFSLRTPEEEQELNEYLEAVRTNPELRMMFSLTKNAKKEDIVKIVRVIKALLGK